nr:hypothetical protein [Solanum melongena]
MRKGQSELKTLISIEIRKTMFFLCNLGTLFYIQNSSSNTHLEFRTKLRLILVLYLYKDFLFKGKWKPELVSYLASNHESWHPSYLRNSSIIRLPANPCLLSLPNPKAEGKPPHNSSFLSALSAHPSTLWHLAWEL